MDINLQRQLCLLCPNADSMDSGNDLGPIRAEDVESDDSGLVWYMVGLGIMFFACFSTYISRCDHQERRRLQEEFGLARMFADYLDLNRMAEVDPALDKLTDEQKKDLLESVLRTEVFRSTSDELDDDDVENNDDESTIVTADTTFHTLKTDLECSTNTLAYGDDDGSVAPEQCAICLEPFQSLQQVSVSKRCTHQFHKECMLDWMMKRLDCPICRRPYLDQRPVVVPSTNSNNIGTESDQSDELSNSSSEVSV